MTLRTFIDKNGNEWEWDETPEVEERLKKLHNHKETVVITDLRKPHNYQDPLYVPHPDLKNGKKTD